jgi:glutamine phosphoribosylpyrophosphate amidotransferase
MLKALNEPGMHFCCACFDGNYPCELFDSCEENQKSLFEDSGINEYY